MQAPDLKVGPTGLAPDSVPMQAPSPATPRGSWTNGAAAGKRRRPDLQVGRAHAGARPEGRAYGTGAGQRAMQAPSPATPRGSWTNGAAGGKRRRPDLQVGRAHAGARPEGRAYGPGAGQRAH